MLRTGDELSHVSLVCGYCRTHISEPLYANHITECEWAFLTDGGSGLSENANITLWESISGLPIPYLDFSIDDDRAVAKFNGEAFVKNAGSSFIGAAPLIQRQSAVHNNVSPRTHEQSKRFFDDSSCPEPAAFQPIPHRTQTSPQRKGSEKNEANKRELDISEYAASLDPPVLEERPIYTKGDSNGSHKQDAIDLEQFTKSLVICENCGRRFTSRSLEVHQKGCTQWNPSKTPKKVGSPEKAELEKDKSYSNLSKSSRSASSDFPRKQTNPSSPPISPRTFSKFVAENRRHEGKGRSSEYFHESPRYASVFSIPVSTADPRNSPPRRTRVETADAPIISSNDSPMRRAPQSKVALDNSSPYAESSAKLRASVDTQSHNATSSLNRSADSEGSPEGSDAHERSNSRSRRRNPQHRHANEAWLSQTMKELEEIEQMQKSMSIRRTSVSTGLDGDKGKSESKTRLKSSQDRAPNMTSSGGALPPRLSTYSAAPIASVKGTFASPPVKSRSHSASYAHTPAEYQKGKPKVEQGSYAATHRQSQSQSGGGSTSKAPQSQRPAQPPPPGPGPIPHASSSKDSQGYSRNNISSSSQSPLGRHSYGVPFPQAGNTSPPGIGNICGVCQARMGQSDNFCSKCGARKDLKI